MKTEQINIVKHINNLLLLQDFIIIPGFGAFVGNYHHAEIDKSGFFIPPYKSISFNSAILQNDGFLINYISEKENIDYNKSKILIENFVQKTYNNLESRQEVFFENIGVFNLDKNYNINFNPETKINFLAGSYGLSSVNFPKLEKYNKKIDRTIKDKNALSKALKSKTAQKIYLIIPVIILLSIISTNYNYNNKKTLKINTAEIINTNNEKSLIERKLDSMTKKENALLYKEPVKHQKIKSDFKKQKIEIKKEIITKNTKVPETNKQEIKNEKIEIKNISKPFYLVAGSFSNIQNAEKFAKKLSKKGLSAKVIKHKHKYRVSAGEFENKKQAKSESKKLKTKGIKTWISKR